MVYRVWTGLPAALAAMLLVASAASAQNGNLIDNPQLRDFRLRPTQRPDSLPQTPPPTVLTPAPPVTQPQATPSQAPAPARQTPSQNQAASQARDAARTRATPAAPSIRPAPAGAAPVSPAPPAQTQPAPSAAPPQPAPAAPLEPVPVAPAPSAAPSPPAAGGGLPWLYLLPVAALALLGFVLLRRRRRAEEEEAYVAGEMSAPVVVAAPPAPRPAPAPAERPWIALSLQVNRASATLDETIVSFDLEIANTGKVPARNLRVDVKMFNAGQEQDSEIGAFFRSAGRQSTKLNLPGIAAESSGVIRGDVTMKRDDMRAVVLEEKYLFIPMIAVNVLYDWDEDGSGQTSKSWVVGRELQQDPPAAKMGAFRVDQGPRIWRTVGQRQHSLERRV